MTTKSCLYLKPRATEAEGREKREEFSDLIESSIEQAGLTPLGESGKGLEVADISMEVGEMVYQANVVVVDATRYEERAGSGFPLCPFLYYFMALSHSLGNKTILVTDNARHLPPSLVSPHTVTCAEQNHRAFQAFKRKFSRVAQEILDEDIKPDNPIQAYLKAVELDELARDSTRAQAEIARLRAKGDESQAAEAVLKAKERVKEETERIVFRRVSDAEGAD